MTWPQHARRGVAGESTQLIKPAGASGLPIAHLVTHSTTTGPGPLGEAPDPHERLSADDQATLRESQFLQASLSAVRAASAAPAAPSGVCGNCAAQCLPTAKYCDEDCRADHEQRLATLRRQGRAR